MEINITWNICRVCLQEEKKPDKKYERFSDIQFVHLFDENKRLPALIFELSGIFMKPHDSLPDKICGKCVAVVNNAEQFRKTCRSSNSYLQSILERTKSASTLFKPEKSTCEIERDEGLNEDVEPSPSILEDKFEQKFNKENEKLPDDRKIINFNIEQHKYEIEELNDNTSDYTVEEIIERSDDDQLYNETMIDAEDNLSTQSDNITNNIVEDSSLKTSEISQLQKFYMNASFSKENNTEEELYNSNASDCDPLEQCKIKVVDSNNSDKGLNEEDSVSERYMEFVDFDEEERAESEIDESTMTDLEEQLNNNEDQAQVSSTMDRTDEIEIYEDNTNFSNFSSESDKQLLTDESLNSRSVTRSIQKTNEDHLENKNILHNHLSIERSKSPVVFSKHKLKRNFYKSTAHEPNQVYFCEICGNRFNSQNQMNLHMKIHLQHKTHQCEICFKRFITACNLQAHMRIHTGEKPFECKFCGRRFNDRSSHVRHERTHTNEKPFECFECGKSFSLATTLQNHMKVHSDERSYRCDPCGKSFKLPHHLKKHQSTSLHHSVLKIIDNDS